MEGHRRYADEPAPSWYTGPNPSPNSPDSGEYEPLSGAFRLPDQRPTDGYPPPPPPYGTPDPVTTGSSHALPPRDTGTRIPIRGPEYPTIRPHGSTSTSDAPAPASPPPTTYGSTFGGPAPAVPSEGLLSSGPAAGAEPTTVVPPVSPVAARPAEAVYRGRRPFSALAIAVVTWLLMVPVVLLLIQVTFVDAPAVRGIVPAVLLTLGLPLTGLGLYRLTVAGASAGREAWLRPPIAYLPIGLFLLLAAGLAVA